MSFSESFSTDLRDRGQKERTRKTLDTISPKTGVETRLVTRIVLVVSRGVTI